MQKDSILPLLEDYSSLFDEEKLYRQLTLALVREHPENWWQRSLLQGHLTGSAWVLNPDRTKALLIHHRALDKWFQPGGHAEDSDGSLLETARREAQEECGLSRLILLSEAIFDLDIHLIPAKKDVEAHLHYDVRFLFQAENEILNEDLAEVKAVQWVPVAQLMQQNLQQSVRRMVLKTAQYDP
jgi:8-oxo-dGTP pyrophosphatase MutT (NUDIX family)